MKNEGEVDWSIARSENGSGAVFPLGSMLGGHVPSDVSPLPTLGPMTYCLSIPKACPEAILSNLSGEERQIVEIEMAMQHGIVDGYQAFYDDFPKTSRYFLTVVGFTLHAAILQGDMDLFDRTYVDMLRFGDVYNHPYARVASEIMECWVRQLLHVDEGYPDWLLQMDFRHVPLEWRQQTAFVAAHALLARRDFEKAYATARMLLALFDGGLMISSGSIRLRLLAAIACREMNRFDEMNQLYREVAKLVAPQELFSHVIGYTIGPSSPMERALKDYPDFLEQLRDYSDTHYRNVVLIHNHFTNDHLATNLSVREFFLARQLKMGKPYKQIARYLDVSEGRLHNLVIQLYGKLGVHSRKALSPLVW